MMCISYQEWTWDGPPGSEESQTLYGPHSSPRTVHRQSSAARAPSWFSPELHLSQWPGHPQRFPQSHILGSRSLPPRRFYNKKSNINYRLESIIIILKIGNDLPLFWVSTIIYLINFFYELFFKVPIHFISNYQYLFKPKFIFDCIMHVIIMINISLSNTLLFTHNQISGCNKWSASSG